MTMKRSALALMLLAVLLAASCGGSSPATPPADTAEEEPAAEPSPEETYAFADQPYNKVSRGGCTGFEKVGNKKTIAIAIDKPKSQVGEFFYPNCLTDVNGSSLTVKLTNNGMTHHNFIVEGDDIELVVPPGKSGEVDVELGPADEIGFQCTIHERFMFGAFFRKNV